MSLLVSVHYRFRAEDQVLLHIAANLGIVLSIVGCEKGVLILRDFKKCIS
jgi:hypothetical protein